MINYNILASSIDHYNNYNFKRIEVPWLVSHLSDDITRPDSAIPYIVNNTKRLPASGEQSFINLLLKEQLPPGCYQTITPCFRNDEYDMIHTKYFLKNELIITDLQLSAPIFRLLIVAQRFFEKYLGVNTITRVKTKDGWDLMYNDIELGSYGYKEYGHLKWYYGTGVAEPRLSNTIKIWDITNKKLLKE